MSFNEKAVSYEGNSQIQKDLIAWALPLLDINLSSKRVLELGAGRGLLTTQLLGHCPESYIASDIAPKMVELSKKDYPQADWRIINAWEPAKELGPFDCIASSSLLQWAIDPAKVLSAWHSLLKPKGYVLSLFFLEGTLSELQQQDGVFPSLNWRSRSEWEQYFSEANLNVVSSASKKVSYSFKSMHELLRTLHASGTRIGNASYSLKNLKQLIKQPGAVQSTWHFYAQLARAKN